MTRNASPRCPASWRWPILLLLVSAVAASAAPPRLFGTQGYGDGQTSTLVELDPATGALLQTIGPVGYLVNGLDYDPTTGKLFGGTAYQDPNFNGLIEIDMTTGAGTPVGAASWGRGGPEAITNITVNSAGQMFGWSEWTDSLVAIDTTTGVATDVGPSGIGTWQYGLSFDSTDVLFLVNGGGEVFSVDAATGAATSQGSIGTTAHHGDFHPDTDLYYGLTWTFGTPRTLLVADLGAGTYTAIGEVGDLHTLAFILEPTAISLVKTVGTTPGVCAATTEITVPPGTGVTYCFTVTNNGDVAFNFHDLVDSELGALLTGTEYLLEPGGNTSILFSTTIGVTTVNTATWTAYNAGPTDVATAQASATVNVAYPDIDVDPLSLSATQLPDTISTQTLSIGNTGGDSLVWMILEQPTITGARNSPVPPAGVPAFVPTPADELVGGELPAAVPLGAPDPAARQLAKQALLATGLLLVPDSTNDRIMALDPITGNVIDANFVPSNPVVGTGVNAILNAAGNRILLSDQTGDVVHEFDLNGNYIGIFAPAGGVNPAILDNIRGIALRPSGNLLVTVASGANTNAVAEFDTSGNYLGNFIANDSGGLGSPWDPYLRAGDWLVSGNAGTTGVLRYDLSGNFLNVFAPISTFPEQVAEAANGNVLVANFSPSDNEGVHEFTAAGVFVGRYDPAGLGGYRGVYELGNGNILTTTGAGVFEIDRSGNLVDTKISGISGRFIEYVLIDSDCVVPADVPWLSTSPVSGTTPAASVTPVDVTFDSTGLAPGTYTANLCVLSNDPDPGPGNGTELVVVPVELTVAIPEEPAIEIVKTVGTTAGVCAATTEITVPAGTTVYYCYAVTNTGNVTLNLHDLVDDQLGTLFTSLNYALTPGSSIDTVAAGLAIPAVINTTTVNTATWTAYNAGPTEVATAQASATVNVTYPDIDVDPLSLAATQPPDTTTQQPLTIANVGLAPLNWEIFEEVQAFVGGISSSGPLAAVAAPQSLAAAGAYAHDLVAVAPAQRGIEALVIDGSFENGPPPASAWTETSNTACEWIGDWAAIWGVAAFDGSFDYWAGGYCGGGPTTSSVEQTLAVPVIETTLSFWYLAYRTDPDDVDPDHAYIEVNGTTVWSLDLVQANNTYPNWVNATVNLGAWAGQSVTLKLGAVSLGAQTGNIRFDYVEFVNPQLAACEAPADIPWLSVSPTGGTTAPAGSTPVTVTFDSTGLAAGTYTANLCITSNDPDPGPGNGTDLVIVPVELTVAIPDEPAIEIVKTVGTTAGVCAATTEITVPAGTTVYYCYAVTNTGNVTLSLHDLVDDQVGTLFTGLNYDLTPGSSIDTVAAGLSIPAVISVDTTNTATWTAYNAGPVNEATAQASATVNILAEVTVTVVVGTPGAGTVTGGGPYTIGDTATVQAFPNPGWTFLHWLVDGNEITDNPYSFEVTGDVTLTAIFQRQEVEAIPAAGTTGLVLLLGLLLAAGVFVLRRMA